MASLCTLTGLYYAHWRISLLVSDQSAGWGCRRERDTHTHTYMRQQASAWVGRCRGHLRQRPSPLAALNLFLILLLLKLSRHSEGRSLQFYSYFWHESNIDRSSQSRSAVVVAVIESLSASVLKVDFYRRAWCLTLGRSGRGGSGGGGGTGEREEEW